MTSPHGPYKSRLFSNLNRQSHKLRDRLGQTVRQIQQAAQWGVQALITPLYWLLHPQEWLGPVLGGQSSQDQGTLPPGDRPEPTPTAQIPPDQPLNTVLATLQSLLTEQTVDIDLESTSTQKSQLPAVLRPSLRHWLTAPPTPPRVSVASPPPSQSVNITVAPAADVVPQSPDTPNLWARSLQAFFPLTPRDDEVEIRGIASTCGDRRLVLTTTENLTLDILTPAQQQQIHRLILREVAQLAYQQRYLWALQQHQWHGIPLTTSDSAQLFAPVDWLWQGVYYWQTRALPAVDLSFLPIPASDSPALQKWRETFSTESLSQLPARLKHLPHDVQQFQQAIGDRLRHHPADPDLPQPDQLQQLLQAAVEYFFGNPTAATPTLTGDRSPEKPWLQWQDLFAPRPPLSDPLTPRRTEWSEETLTVADLLPPQPQSASASQTPALLSPPSSAMVSKTPGNLQTSSRGVAKAQPSYTTQDPWDETELEPLWSSSPLPPAAVTTGLTPQPTQPHLETAFDWIETQARTIGHEKHILVWCLEKLDTLIYWLEEAGKWIWQKFQQVFHPFRSGSLTKREEC